VTLTHLFDQSASSTLHLLGQFPARNLPPPASPAVRRITLSPTGSKAQRVMELLLRSPWPPLTDTRPRMGLGGTNDARNSQVAADVQDGGRDHVDGWKDGAVMGIKQSDSSVVMAHRGRNRWIAVALVLALGGGLAGFLVTRSTPDRSISVQLVYVPNVIGLPAEAANAKLMGAQQLHDFYVVLQSAPGTRHGSCHVVAQSPRAGQAAVYRSVAVLTVEGCPRNRVIGNLVGKRIDRVLPGLRAAGFQVFDGGGGFPGMPRSYDYTVSMQEPPAGTEAAPGSQIWVLVDFPQG